MLQQMRRTGSFSSGLNILDASVEGLQADTFHNPGRTMETAEYTAYQHTLQSSVCFSGIAVHSGKSAHIEVHPATIDHGITFQRRGMSPIQAKHQFVTENDLCTRLSDGVQHFDTTEHLMAAFAACGIDNALVVVEGDEMPILDGSALPYVQQFSDVGTQRQSAARKFLRITRHFAYTDGDSCMNFAPVLSVKHASMHVEIDFTDRIPKIGIQEFHQQMIPGLIRDNLVSARTFGLESERRHHVQKMQKGLGSSSDNVLLFDDNGGVLNSEGMRFDDECVRHKMLDMIGDLYMAGWPIVAQIHAVRPGHTFNGRALKALLQSDAIEIV